MKNEMNIPPAKIFFPKEDIESLGTEIQQILQSGSLILGNYTQSFENRFAKFIGMNYGIAVNSGTSALEISLRIFDVKGKEVIVPTNTNFATPAAVLHAGGNIKFIDVESETFSITPDALKKALTQNTAGVIVVHIGGVITPDMEEIQKICKEAGIFLLEDAAHAHGSALNGTMAGAFGDASAFSFYPTKVITSVEGGMILTRSEQFAEQAKIYRDQGKEKYGKNVHTVLGNSWRISEVHAAVGISQLKRIDTFIHERTNIARLYDSELIEIPKITSLLLPPTLRCNYYKYIALLDPLIERTKLKKILKEQYSVRLSGEVYEVPCHRQPVFLGKSGDGRFPIADHICSRHICLPIYASMKEEEARHVIMSLKQSLIEL